MATNTRQKIIQILENNGVASAAQLSAELGLTKANIQYHLQKLLAENTVEALIDATSAGEPGRPHRFFRLMQNQRPDNLSGLLIAILDELSSSDGHVPLVSLINIAKKMTGEIALSSSVQRFNRAVIWLNNCGYQAHWETHQTGPCFIYRNCPYASVWPKHPELCNLDRAILQQLTGFNVTEQTHTFPQKLPVGYCVFQLASP